MDFKELDRDYINMLETKMNEGIKIGEHKKATEIARNLLDILDVKVIAEKTGLTVTEVKELRRL